LLRRIFFLKKFCYEVNVKQKIYNAPLITTDDGLPESGFASFENTLLTLGGAEHEYKCVWNGAGISDNRAFAGGVSEYLFAPAMTYDGGAWGSRGSKACALWPLESSHNDVRLPVLPLQNTVSGAMLQRVMMMMMPFICSYRNKNEPTAILLGTPPHGKEKRHM
jgi:hypothetical protein